MRKFVVGDIHGGYKALQQVIERAHIHKNDAIIFLGDYCDGWSESPQVIDFFLNMQENFNCVFLRGNHDELVLQWLLTAKDNELWYANGGKSTMIAYENVDKETRKKHISFLQSLQDYYIDEDNRLFVHAGFTNVKGVAHEYYPRLLYWDRSLWEMALCIDPFLPVHSKYYPKRLKLYNEIFIGHTPVTFIEETTPVHRANVWNIDTGAAFMGAITIMDVDTKQYWQSDPVYTLYPEENGRNGDVR